jgi:peptidoglycan biosynthesis protein MviN/MurJ (putative lipid II flippase)
MAFNATLSYLAAQYYGVEGISLGFTIASVINGLLLFIILRLKLGDELTDLESNFDLPLLTATMKIILATVIMGIVSYSLIYAIGPRVNTHTVVGIFTQASLSGLGGILVYAALTYWMGFGEVRYVKQLLFRQR